MAPDLSPHQVRALDARYGLADFVTNAADYGPTEGLSTACLAVLTGPDQPLLARHMAFAAQPQAHILCPTDVFYPWGLRYIPDPPLLLWVRGDVRVLQRRQIAIVGARKATPMARTFTETLAGDLAAAGWVVTSGLALGVDAAAHRGALGAGGDTVAVLGSACDRVYPPQHHALAELVITQGALVSEWPLGTGPRRAHFPQRNRLISGMSMGTVVVEANQRSGSLITARLAAEQGREVFAVPGAVQNPMAAGCHALIQQGAKLVCGVGDILEEFELAESIKKRSKQSDAPSSRAPKLADRLQLLLECVDFVPTSVDLVRQRSQRELPEILSDLSVLVLAGHVIQVSQGYVRCPPSPERPTDL